MLLADANGSIDSREFALQRQGHASALTDPEVLAVKRKLVPEISEARNGAPLSAARD